MGKRILISIGQDVALFIFSSSPERLTGHSSDKGLWNRRSGKLNTYSSMCLGKSTTPLPPSSTYGRNSSLTSAHDALTPVTADSAQTAGFSENLSIYEVTFVLDEQE